MTINIKKCPFDSMANKRIFTFSASHIRSGVTYKTVVLYFFLSCNLIFFRYFVILYKAIF